MYQEGRQALNVFGRYFYLPWDPRGATIFIWLMRAGRFKNCPALHLYLAHGFAIIGLYGTAEMMLLCDVKRRSGIPELRTNMAVY